MNTIRKPLLQKSVSLNQGARIHRTGTHEGGRVGSLPLDAVILIITPWTIEPLNLWPGLILREDNASKMGFRWTS